MRLVLLLLILAIVALGWAKTRRVARAAKSGCYGCRPSRRVSKRQAFWRLPMAPVGNACGCQQPKFINPCFVGRPILAPAGTPAFCNFQTTSCPAAYFCHVGFSVPTTCCCPQLSPDPCTQPLNRGTGTSQVQRWFFVPTTKTCQVFQYAGMKGNQNNFVSKDMCEAQCGAPPAPNPCPQGQPIASPTPCSRTQGCPNNYWCHIGSTTTTTTCCPRTGDPCTLPPVTGSGSGTLPRWAYDSATRVCRQFSYTGMQGNENNFLSQAECEAQCPIWDNVCARGQPLLSGNKPQFCSPSSRCPAGYYCHVGATTKETMCCQSSGANICSLPQMVGVGTANLQRFYYDSAANQCLQFMYGGTKGNENNFLTQTDCESVCRKINPCQPPDTPLLVSGRAQQCNAADLASCPNSHFCHPGADADNTVCCPLRGDRCAQPQITGTGTSQLQRWSYNSQTDECVQFTYAGTAGNSNNFLSKQQCEVACPGFRGYCPHGKPLAVGGQPQKCSIETLCQTNYICHVNTEKATSVCCPDPTYFCFLPEDAGTGTQSGTRYRYNPSTDTCVPFTYSGQGGNLNNFADLAKCTKVCCKDQSQGLSEVPIAPSGGSFGGATSGTLQGGQIGGFPG